MKKAYFIILFASALLFISFSSNPPQGNSGAPFDRTCARSGCHSGGAGVDGAITITGIPQQVSPGDTYDFTLTLEATSGAPRRGGFQMVAVNDNETDAGALSNPGNGATLSSFQNRTYFEHQPAQNFNGNTVEFTATWTAPMSGTATFYTSAIFGNGSGAGGDRYITDNVTFEVSSEQNSLSAEVVDIQNVSCVGESDGAASVNATGGDGSFTYMWSSGETGPMATMLSSGANSVTIQSGDQILDLSFKVEEPEPIEITLLVDGSLECSNDNSASLSAEVIGGIGNISYLWSDGTEGNMINDLGAGQYNITVTDENGCTAVASESLFAVDEEAPSIEVAPEVSLDLDENGMVSIDDLVGVLIEFNDNCDDDLEFTWSPMDFNCDNVGNNTLTIVVSDNSGNRTESTTSVIINDPQPPSINCVNERLDIATCAAFTYTQPVVTDNCDNTRLELISGIGINGSFPIGETIEIYQVSDLSGNTATCAITIMNDPELSADISILDVSCLGANDGSVRIEPIGVNDPYDVSIDGGSDTDLSPGEYSYTITDFTGCAIQNSFIINEPEELILDNVELVKPATSNSGDGSISVEVIGGNPPYDYQWFVDGQEFSTDENLSLLFPGVYSLEITDSRGCTVISEELILEEVTSINDPELDARVSIFPIPADQVLNVSMSEVSFDDSSITLYNLSGIEVFHKLFKENETAINTRNIDNGLYILKLRISKDVIVRSILVQH